MRTVSDTFQIEAQKDSYIPYARVYLPNYVGGLDLTQYVRKIIHDEQQFGGSATIRLVDPNDWFFVGGEIPLKLNGQKVLISYGFKYADGSTEVVAAAPLWIRNVKLESAEGMLEVQLECFDVWQRFQNLHTQTFQVFDRTKTIYEIISDLVEDLAEDISVHKDTEDLDGIMDNSDYKPYYEMTMDMSVAAVIAELISLTNCGCRMRSDGLHFFVLPTSFDVPHITYKSGGHVYFSEIWEDELPIPNRILVVDILPTSPTESYNYSGLASDTNTYDRLGYYMARVFVRPSAQSDEECEMYAEAILSTALRARSQGLVIVPHDARVEIGDIVEVDDMRW